MRGLGYLGQGGMTRVLSNINQSHKCQSHLHPFYCASLSVNTSTSSGLNVIVTGLAVVCVPQFTISILP